MKKLIVTGEKIGVNILIIAYKVYWICHQIMEVVCKKSMMVGVRVRLKGCKIKETDILMQ